ncbi:hypothetical protein EXS70_04570 [Candidatus Peribacteria bacterium]|nr:hypothetical protein [Candidatus Peribacteria bacterium]
MPFHVPPSHRLSHAKPWRSRRMLLLLSALLLVSGAVPGAFAQDDFYIQPLPDPPPTAGETSPRQYLIIPVDVDFNNPDVDNNGVADAVQDGGTEYRKGNCCVLELFEELHGCTWNVGLDKTDQDAVDECKFMDYDFDDVIDDGIHYVQGNPDMSVPDNSWKACSVQCGTLARKTFCDPTNYTCSTKYPDDPSIEWGDVEAFDTSDQCSASCQPPVPVRTSVGCACAKDEDGGATVSCTIDVSQDPLSFPNDGYARETSIEKVTVSLFGEGSLTVDNNFVYDADGKETDENIYVNYLDEDETSLEFTSDDVISIPGGDTESEETGDTESEETGDTESEETGDGGGFFAKISMPAGQYAEGLLQVTTTTGHDDGEDDNIDYQDIVTVEGCGEFSLDAECDLQGDSEGYEEPGEPILRNTYTLMLPKNTTQNDMDVEFNLNPRRENPSCLETGSEWVEVPYFLSDICSYDEDAESVSCTVPAGTLPDDLDSLWFTAYPNTEKACPRIPVTATVTIGTLTPVTHEIYEKPEVCDKCTSCENALTEEDCDAMPSDESDPENPVPFCNWKYDAEVEDFACRSNDQNDLCPLWIADCHQTLPPDDAPPGQDPYYAFNFVGKSEGIYRPTAADQSPWGVGDEEKFANVTSADHDSYFTIRWHEEPDQDPDSEEDESVAQYEDECEEANQRQDPSDSEDRNRERTDYDPNQPDWYCSLAFEDISFNKPDTISLANPEDREDCKVYTPAIHPLNDGTVYAYTAYYQEDYEDIDGFSCPATCELVTKKWVTCYVSAKSGCESDYDIDQCIAKGGMVFTNGASGQNSCNQTCSGGLCGGVPPDWHL